MTKRFILTIQDICAMFSSSTPSRQAPATSGQRVPRIDLNSATTAIFGAVRSRFLRIGRARDLGYSALAGFLGTLLLICHPALLHAQDLEPVDELNRNSSSSAPITLGKIPFGIEASGPGGWIALLGQASGHGKESVLVSGPYRDESDHTQTAMAVYTWDTQTLEQLGESSIDHPALFSTPVEYKQGVVLIGGMDEGGLSPRVSMLTLDGQNISETSLPNLPKPLAASGAAMLGSKLYVVGGTIDRSLSMSSEDLYSLDLDDSTAVWQRHEPMPGSGRILPAVFALYDQLNVVGGFESNGLSDGENDLSNLTPTTTVWTYRIEPIDGTTDLGWQLKSPVPEPIAGAAVKLTGQAHAVLLGGYSKAIRGSDLLSDTPPTGGTASQAWLTHLITDTWIPAADLTGPMPPGRVLNLLDRHVWFSAHPGCPPQYVLLQRDTKTLVWTDYAVIAIYFVLMAGVGVWFARKQDSSEEFALGNRKVKWWASGISKFATGASSISFMAIPAITFSSNLVWLAPIVIFVLPAYYLHGYLMYPLLRQLNLTSTFEYLERRYNTPLRLIASLQSISFQLFGRMSVVLLLPALAISAVTGLNVMTSVILMGVLTTIYTTFGGFEAVIWTDVIQGAMMVFGCLIMIATAIWALPHGITDFYMTSVEYNKFMFAIWDLNWIYPVFWFAALSFITQQVTFAADQPTVQRVYATPAKDMKKLAGMSAFCGVLIAVLVNLTGLSLFAFFKSYPEELDPSMSLDQIVPLYVVQSLPIGLSGLIVAAIFAASMSTLSSSMNSVATLINEDFYRRIRPEMSDRAQLRFMMAMSLVAGVIGTGAALYMASAQITSMFEVWNQVAALLGGGFVGMFVLGIFTTRTNSAGAITGALSSIAMTLYLKYFTDAHWVSYAPLAVLSCVVVGYVASFVLPGQPRNLAGLTIFTRVKSGPSPSSSTH
ncbi:MAG: sodium/solute symporter [Planctomycetota bacterium]